MAGPLNPQCVISAGPSCDCFIEGQCTRALGTLTPESPLRSGLSMLKVKREGARSVMVWPSDWARVCPAVCPPPVAITT